MPRRLTPADPELVAAARSRTLAATPEAVSPDDLRLLVRHYLAILAEAAPGRSVEVRVPPHAAVQCVPGPRHTRGTPPGVVEVDPLAWVRLAVGALTWADAVAEGAVHASGERTDLTPYLPLEKS